MIRWLRALIEWYDDVCRFVWVYLIEPVQWAMHVEMLKREGKWCYDCDAPKSHCACAPGN